MSRDSKKIKIAFYLKAHSGWTGGTVYLKTLFQSLRSTNSDNVQIGLIGHNGDISNHPDLRNLVDEVIVVPALNKWRGARAFRSLGTRLLHRDFVNDSWLGQHEVDLIAFGDAPPGSRIPSLGWIPDFQHRHFPEFFSAQECRHREESYARLIERSARVIVISESTKRDFLTFAPHAAHKVRVLHPITAIPSSVYDSDANSIREQYDLPCKFFYLPNQFWKHKNHLTVFEAVRILKQKGLPIFLVCSGFCGDYRHATFFSDLLLEISRMGIRNNVALVGVLPRDHVFQLMRQSVAVVNASLFEGFGMTVDEARSFGKPLLLSDIPAHREQNPARAVFFNASDADELANNMETIWREHEPGANRQAEANYRRERPALMSKYAASFIETVSEVV